MMNDRIWTLLGRQLTGEATSIELEELEELKRESSTAEKSVADVADWWLQNTAVDTEFLEATYLAHLERMRDKDLYLSEENNEPAGETAIAQTNAGSPVFKKSFNKRRIIIAAILIASLALSWFFLKPAPGDVKPAVLAKAEVATRNGSRSKILLPDGTNVWLNSGSKLTYSRDLDTGNTREVFLTGEAFFDVVENAKRPFIIHTTRMDVKVLGTRFNVKAYEEDKTTETSLIKGSVAVFLKDNPGRKYLLKPNQKLVLSNDLPLKAAKTKASVALSPAARTLVEIKPLTYLQGTETDIESSWTKNVLSFEDEAFVEVAKKMERWYDVNFEFKNKNWEQQFLNGSFKNESLQQAMKALKYSTGFNYKIEGRRIIIF